MRGFAHEMNTDGSAVCHWMIMKAPKSYNSYL